MILETKKMTKGLCAVAAIFAVAACTGKSNNNPASAVTPQEEGVNNDAGAPAPAPETGAPDVTAPDATLPSSGNHVATMEVTGYQVLGEGDQAVTHEDLMTKFPMLAEKTAWLSMIDKIYKTDANTWEFFSQGKLILVLGYDAAGQLIVMNSTGGFTADMISLVSEGTEQKEMTNHLTFLLSECIVEKAPEQDQKQEEKKEEQKQEEKTCGAVKSVLHFKAVIQDKEQDQKDQEQGGKLG